MSYRMIICPYLCKSNDQTLEMIPMKYFLILPLFFLMISCGSQTADTPTETATEEEEVVQPEINPNARVLNEDGDYSKLEALERYFGSDMEFEDPAIAKELIRETDIFVKNYPDDRRAPIAMYRAAGAAKNLSDWTKALELFERTWKEYPDTFVAPMALFLNGFIYDDTLNEKEKALQLYKIFEERYPDNTFMPEVQKLMDMINLTEEEMIEKLKEQGKFERY